MGGILVAAPITLLLAELAALIGTRVKLPLAIVIPSAAITMGMALMSDCWPCAPAANRLCSQHTLTQTCLRQEHRAKTAFGGDDIMARVNRTTGGFLSSASYFFWPRLPAPVSINPAKIPALADRLAAGEEPPVYGAR